jgi:hypothetical protein
VSRQEINAPNVIDRANVGRFQWQVLLICLAVAIMDGFDTQTLSYAAPALMKAWNIPGAALAPALSAGRPNRACRRRLTVAGEDLARATSRRSTAALRVSKLWPGGINAGAVAGASVAFQPARGNPYGGRHAAHYRTADRRPGRCLLCQGAAR